MGKKESNVVFKGKGYLERVDIVLKKMRDGFPLMIDGKVYEEYKYFLDGLYNPSLSSNLLMHGYSRIQAFRCECMNMANSNSDLNSNPSFKKMLHTLKKYSYKICHRCNKTYTTTEEKDFYQLILQTRNLDFLETLFNQFPMEFNCLENDGYELIVKVTKGYIGKLKEHVLHEKLSLLDELIYFDLVLQRLYQKNFSYMPTIQKEELKNLFVEARDFQKELRGECLERYSYFLNRFVLAFLEGIKSDRCHEKKKNFNIPNTLDDVIYKHMIEKDFNVAVKSESSFILTQNKEIVHSRKMKRERIYTIDNVETKIKDDGFSLKKENGLYYLDIYAANPLAYFDSSSPIYEEAMKRTSSIRVGRSDILMMPDDITCRLSSLNVGGYKNCYCYSCVFDEVTKKLVSFDVSLRKVMVGKNYTYNGFDIEPTNDEELELFTLVHEVTPILMANYNMQEAYRLLYRQNSNVSGTNVVSTTKSAQFVEAMMVFANMQFAKLSYEQHIPIIYRNVIVDEGIEMINSLLNKIDAKKDNQELMNKLLEMKSQGLKRECSSINQGHWGLGIPYYSHATSALRRAEDLFNMNAFNKCYFEGVDDKDYAVLEVQARNMATYINHKKKSLTSFAKEYNNLVRKKK